MTTALRAEARSAKAALLLLVLCAASTARAQELPSGPVSLAGGRVVIGTDISLALTPQDDTDGSWFNYTDYEHNALRLFRAGVTADVRLTDRVSVLTEVRSENGDAIEPYALYVRVRPWLDRPIDIQGGRIPPTFGAFARRDYGAGNPLIGYPLAYQYLTAVRPDALPASPDDVLRMRARGWRPSYPIGSLAIAPGLPLITAFRWDTGVQVRIGPESLNASVALTNGTASDPRTRDNNGGKQVAGRLEWQSERGAGDRRFGGDRVLRVGCGARSGDDDWRNGPLETKRARYGCRVLARSLVASRRVHMEPVAGADVLCRHSMPRAPSSRGATRFRRVCSWRAGSITSASPSCHRRRTRSRGTRQSRGSKRAPATTSAAIFC